MAAFTVGEAYYNGFFFPFAISSSLSHTPVQEGAGRYPKYQDFTFSIEFIVYPGCDEYVTIQKPDGSGAYTPIFPVSKDINEGYEEIRKLLNEDGGFFSFSNKGIGESFTIVGDPDEIIAGSEFDVAFGPKARIANWESMGDNCSAKVTFELTARIGDCPGVSTPTTNAEEFFWSIDWDIDVAGVTSRTISGQVSRPVWRIPSGATGTKKDSLTDSADRLREQLRHDIPLGFRRERQSWTLSPDRKTLNFTIVDVEIAGDQPFERGIVDCQMTQRISNKDNIHGNIWSVDFSGTFTAGKGYPRWVAWAAFIRVVKSRIDWIRQNARINDRPENKQSLNNNTPQVEPGTKTKVMVMPVKLDMQEDIYGRGMSFSMGFWYTCVLPSLMNSTGFWLPIPGVSWEPWREDFTVAGDIWDVRGRAGLLHDKSEDALIFLCDTSQATNFFKLPGQVIEQTPPAVVYDQLGFAAPTEEDSYGAFETYYRTYEQSKSLMHSPITGDLGHEEGVFNEGMDPDVPRGEKADPEDPDPQDPTGYNIGYGQHTPAIVQKRGATQWEVVFTGRAVRYGYRVPRPTLISYRGAKATRIGDLVYDETIRPGMMENVKIYEARWMGRYLLDKQPGTSPANVPDERTLKAHV